MTTQTYNVLFLCSGNSARSIIAEELLNYWGREKFRAFSAGSWPKGEVQPLALDMLRQMRIPLHEPRSKDWLEFEGEDAPVMDFVFTVCDNAANESCPVWPGQPMTARWGVPDPAAVEGLDIEKSLVFRRTFAERESRIRIFVSLPLESLDRIRQQHHLDNIGQGHGAQPVEFGAET